MCLYDISSRSSEEVISNIQYAPYNQVSGMTWREEMTEVLVTAGQEFSRERRNRYPKSLKQVVAGMLEGYKKSRLAGMGMEGRRPGEDAGRDGRAR